jgi:hypothetical protein
MVAQMALSPFSPPSFAPAHLKYYPDFLKLYLLHTDIFIPLYICKDWYKGRNLQSQSKYTHFSHLKISGSYT